MQLLRAGWLFLAASVLRAQPATDGFPAEAVKLSEPEMRAELSGKSFLVIRPEGGHVRLSFSDSGYVFVSGYLNGPTERLRGNGKWRVEGSAVCVDWVTAQAPNFCLETRKSADGLVLRRLNGDLVRWVPD